MTEPELQARTALHRAAVALVAQAERIGMVLTIETAPRQPLAMGHYAMLVATREARHPAPQGVTVTAAAEKLAELTFQARVQPWLLECFGTMIAGDREERNHRFLEEALELVQACGCSASEAHQLVNYVYGRPVGQPEQEVGGVMVTLAALCLANRMDMHLAAENELARIWTMVEKIRAKQAAKPKHSPLPEAVADNAPRELVKQMLAELEDAQPQDSTAFEVMDQARAWLAKGAPHGR